MTQQTRGTIGSGKRRIADDSKVHTASASTHAQANKQKVYPVKVYEVADAVKIGDFGHMFARVPFWRNRPFVDIRRYTQDTTRPSF
jgi:hypothetical protein